MNTLLFSLVGFADQTESLLIHSWQLPLWITILISISVIAFAALIYRFESGTRSLPLRILLAAIRSALLGLTLWMLAAYSLQPFRSERPELAIVLDSSQSMQVAAGANTGESQSRFEQLRQELLRDNANVLRKINEQYQLKFLAAGEQAKVLASDLDSGLKSLNDTTADQTASRLGASLQQTLELQRGRPTSAVVFVSDGINTDGISISEAAAAYRTEGLPVFAVGVGNDQAEPDVQLADVMLESIAFVGDSIQIPFTLRLQEVPASELKITVRDLSSGSALAEQTVSITENQSTASGVLSFNADRPGTLRIAIEALPVPREKLLENNKIERTLEIRDQAISVLLVQQSPNYEFRFLKSLLDRARQPGSPDKPTFMLTSILLEGDPRYADQDKSAERLLPVSFEQLSKFDVIILGDLGAGQIGSTTLQSIERLVNQQGSGLMVIAGNTDSYAILSSSSLQRLLPTEPPGKRANTNSTNTNSATSSMTFRWQLSPLGMTAQPLQLESDPLRNQSLWQQLPPMNWFIDVGQPKPGSLVWVNHYDFGETSESKPLLIAQYFGKGRVVLQATDETFQWSSHFGNDLYYQRYWNQMIRWLARGKLAGESTAKLSFDRAEYRTGESVGLALKFYGNVPLRENESAEVVLQREGGQRQTITLPRYGNESNIYRTQILNLAAGSYRAIVTKPSLQPPPAAELSMQPPLDELSRTRVDWKSLRSLSEATRGQFLTIDQWRNLPTYLPAGKAIRLQPLPAIPLWNHWLVISLFIVLITSEWLLRRYCRML